LNKEVIWLELQKKHEQQMAKMQMELAELRQQKGFYDQAIGPTVEEKDVSCPYKVPTDVYQDVFEKIDGVLGYIFPLIEHTGSDPQALALLAASTNVAWPTGQHAVMTAVGYKSRDRMFTAAIRAVFDDDWKFDSNDAYHVKFPRLFIALGKIKYYAKKIADDLKTIVGKTTEIDFGTWLTTKTTLLFRSFLNILADAKSWVGRVPWDIYHDYLAVGSHKTGNQPIYGQIDIEVEQDKHFIMTCVPGVPWFTTNTGARIMAGYMFIFLNLLRYIRIIDGVRCKISPYSFYGLRELNASWYLEQDVAAALENAETPGETILNIVNKLLEVLRSAQDTSMMQPKIMNDPNNIVDLEVFRILCTTFFQALKTKEWREGLADAGVPFDPKYFYQPLQYRMAGNLEAIAVWNKWIDDWKSLTGYPLDGPADNQAFVEMGEGVWLDCIKQCSCSRDDIDSTTISLKLKNTFKASNCYWIVEDGQGKWLPMCNIAVGRDGRLAYPPDFWAQASLGRIGTVDRFLATYIRTYPFGNPEIVQARRNMGDNSDWSKMLSDLGIEDIVLGLGLQPAFSGIMLPFHIVDSPDDSVRTKFLPLLPSFSSLKPEGETSLDEKLTAIRATEKQVANILK
jgi:hypothetical protein